MAEKIKFVNTAIIKVHKTFPNFEESDPKQQFKGDKLLATKGLKIWRLQGDIFNDCALRETDSTKDTKIEPVSVDILDEDGQIYRSLDRVHFKAIEDTPNYSEYLVEAEFVDSEIEPKYRVHILLNKSHGGYTATVIDTSDNAPLYGRVLEMKFELNYER